MSLRTRLAILALACTLLSGVAVAVVGRAEMRASVEAERVARLESEVALVADVLVADSWRGADLSEFSEELALEIRARVTIVDADGTVLGDSAVGASLLATLDDHSDRPEIVAARRSGIGSAVRWSDTTGMTLVYFAKRVRVDGETLFVRLSRPVDDLRDAENRFFRAAGLALVFFATLAAVGGWTLGRRTLAPIREITRTLSRLGDPDVGTPAAPADEDLARLADATARAQHQHLLRIEGERERNWILESAAGGMKEGLLVVDRDRRVLVANEALRRGMRGVDNPTGVPLERVFRQPEVIEAVSHALETGEEVRCRVDESTRGGKVYDLQVSPLRSEDDEEPRAAVALSYDVTRLERLESVRQRFVADVSHELRTPLSTIKAAVETLIETSESPSDERFLAMIERQSGRMESLVSDLTDLSKIETGAIVLDPEPVDVADMIRKVVSDLESAATAREVSIRIDLPGRLEILADRRRLDQVLVNLIENAIKFNKPGGTVEIRGRADGAMAEVVIEDSGVGIPADSIPRVFNRFFRVDADRSRETGGTGLGLAIVKHLMQLHCGSVGVESELGQGSKFTLRFDDELLTRELEGDSGNLES